MFRRRRPLRNAAIVGGVAAVAHHAGTRSAQEQYAAPAAPAAPPADVGVTDAVVAELTNLKQLLDTGVISQAEFDTQKQRILVGL
jgi:hypothetical protein